MQLAIDTGSLEGYQKFLRTKTQLDPGSGFEPIELPDVLFGFQRHLCDWAIRQGRAAIFAGVGLGKTLQQLVWAENVVRHTGKNVIIFAPLAVAAQTEREARKFGLEAKVSRDGSIPGKIIITNYERIHYFKPEDFVGAVADESAILKAFCGKRRKQITRFFSKLPYRLLCSAVPSPNDFIELGCQSECLGIMTQSDMLGYFFRETQYMRHTVFREGDFWNTTKWAFKPHSEQPFWRWVSSWARAIRLPSDLGYADDGFILPPIEYRQHIVDVPYIPPGELFPRPAISLVEQKAERDRTVVERCDRVAELVGDTDPAIVWCQYNPEGIQLAKIIPGAVEVAGRHSDDYKEDMLNEFGMGNIRVLVTKPKIACWGMNYQHCSHMTFFPTYSYESIHQGIGRCYRFGQKASVLVEFVAAMGESHVIESQSIKQAQSGRMFDALVRYMNDAMAMYSEDRHREPIVIPEWLKGSEAPQPLEASMRAPWKALSGKPTIQDRDKHTQPMVVPAWLRAGGN